MQQEEPVVEDVEEIPEPAPVEDMEMKADLNRWRRKATKNIGNIEKMQAFTSDYIPAEMAVAIKDSLASCRTEADIVRAFVVDVKPVDSIKALAKSIDNAVAKYEPA
jgi:hypothetical protein